MLRTRFFACGLAVVGAAVCWGLPGSSIAPAARLAPAATPPDAYTATRKYVNCMADHGVPLPQPDARGNINLSPADEARLRKIGRAAHERADKACFHFIRGITSLAPLTPAQKARAVDVLLSVSRCMRRFGYIMGDPYVKELGRGRAAFLFRYVAPATRAALNTAVFKHAQAICETGLSAKMDAAIGLSR